MSNTLAPFDLLIEAVCSYTAEAHVQCLLLQLGLLGLDLQQGICWYTIISIPGRELRLYPAMSKPLRLYCQTN